MEKQTGSKLEKEYVRAVYCHRAYLTYMQSKYIMRNAGLEESQMETRFLGQISTASDMMAENEEGLKSLLRRAKEESEKIGLKLNIQKTNMTSSPIPLW